VRDLERAILQQDPALAPPPRFVVERVRSRPKLVASAAVTFAAVVALGSVFAFRGGAKAPVKVVANSVAVIDPSTDRIVDDIRAGDYPSAVAAGNGSVWVSNVGDNTLTRIDASSRKPSFPNGVQRAIDLAVTKDALWIANATDFETKPPTGGGTIERVSLRDGATKRIRVGPPKTLNEWWTAVASDGEEVWADNGSSRTLVRIDPATGGVLHRIRDVGGARIALGNDAVWVAEYARNAVARVDRRTRAVTHIPVSSRPTTIAVGQGSVWVTTQKPHNALWRIDPETRETTAVIPVPATSRGVATGDGAVWVTSGTYVGEPGVPARPGRVTKIDPRTGRIVKTIVVGYRPDGVTSTKDSCGWPSRRGVDGGRQTPPCRRRSPNWSGAYADGSFCQSPPRAATLLAVGGVDEQQAAETDVALRVIEVDDDDEEADVPTA
jgi:hypothetical protein